MIINNYLEIGVYIFLMITTLYHRKFIWLHFVKEPITGGNGVTRMDELAKYVLLILAIYMVYVKAPNYTEQEMLIIIGAVVTLAGLQMYTNNKNNNN